MYLPVPTQPDCATAWLEAAKLVDNEIGHHAYNVIVDVKNPISDASRQNPIVESVDSFLLAREKSVECVANTIFPDALYRRHGAPTFFDAFQERILPKVRKNQRWSGYYFERMTSRQARSGKQINQLWDIVERIRRNDVRSLNKFELALFDPELDVDASPYGGQCLSFLSFKLLSGPKTQLALTAMYRNHYYIEKLLGNLIGLGRLMHFVAREAEIELGSLTVISTHAQIDQPGKETTRADVIELLQQCAELRSIS